MIRDAQEEAALDDYFAKNGIAVVDNEGNYIEENKARHKLYYAFGFGYLALFRSMRFLGLVFLTMSLIMLVSGISFYKSSPVSEYGFTLFDTLSIANSDFATNVCI